MLYARRRRREENNNPDGSEMPIGIRPTVDFVFKLLFGSPERSRITIHFLNAILGGQRRITKISFRNPILHQETEDDKLAILDILATDEHGRTFIIEMQTSVPAGMRQRLTYYTACLYVDQLYEGENYPSLRPAISICVLTKPIFADDSRLHLDFRLRDSSGTVLTDDLQVHLLQLSNLAVTAQNVFEASPMEQWAYFLLNAENMTMAEIKRLFPDPEFSEAAEVLEMIAKTPEQRQRYDARLKFQRDEAARGALACDEARDEGRIEGLREGIEKGVELGELFGRITTLQGLLGLAPSTRDELSAYEGVQLNEMAEALQLQLRTRGG